MALWISGGRVVPVDSDGVTLLVRILPAREMIDFLHEAETIQADFGGNSLDTFTSLIERGLTGWSGDHAPPFGREAIEGLSIGALQRIMEAIVKTNTLTDTDRGNSHAS
jgi:hypothetical protein